MGGKAFWLASPLGVPNNRMLLALPLIAFVGNLKGNVGNILAKTDAGSLLQSLRYMLLLTAATLLCHASGLAHDCAYMYVYVFAYAKSTVLCQFSHAAAAQYRPFRLLDSVLLGGLLLQGLLLCAGVQSPALKLALTVAAAADFAVFACVLVAKTAALLRINVFSVARQ